MICSSMEQELLSAPLQFSNANLAPVQLKTTLAATITSWTCCYGDAPVAVKDAATISNGMQVSIS